MEEIQRETEELKSEKKTIKEEIESLLEYFKSVRLAVEDAEAAAIVSLLQNVRDPRRLAALQLAPNRLAQLDGVLAAALRDPPAEASASDAVLAAAESDRQTQQLAAALRPPPPAPTRPAPDVLHVADIFIQDVRHQLGLIKCINSCFQ